MKDNYIVMATDKCYFKTDRELTYGWNIEYTNVSVTKNLNSATTYKEYEDAKDFTKVYGGKIVRLRLEEV